jgi:drug/metabolite transporter (DMT)-like permease
MSHRIPILYALLAAVLFGASTPLAKLLLDDITPQVLAGLLYAGSGIGLSLLLGFNFLRRNKRETAPLTKTDLPWLGGAIAAGGIAAPLLLMTGISHTSASSAALMLNLEGVFTAMLAWFVFKENFDWRIFAGMALIIAGGALLSWNEAVITESFLPIGALLIAGACFCWGIDNNLTRKVSASDPVQIACIKGLVAGGVNLAAAALMGVSFPAITYTLAAGLVGLAGYGVSLVLFVLALRHLGTARSGAYFSTAPFAGAALSFLLLGDAPGLLFWLAAAFMGTGVWLHLTERHEHEHTHEPMDHTHEHVHDAHHRHDHDFPWDGAEPHTHPHKHEPLTHSHAHYPDIHHRHGHT